MKKLFTAFFAAIIVAFSAHAATLTPIQLLNPAGSTSGQAVISTGSSTAPTWGNVTAAALAAQAANTVVANATAASASPTAVALPSCSASNSALQYTSSTGFTCGTSYALTGSTLAQFAATTSAQLAAVLSDETGSGAAVFGTSPTIGSATLSTPTISGGTINNAAIGATTPSTGKFTTLQATGAITPSSTAGIVGTATNDSPNAGSIGELVSNSATGTSLSNGTAINGTSISLTAGDWDAIAQCRFNTTTATIASGAVGISTTSATYGAFGTIGNFVNTNNSVATTNQFYANTILVPLRLASTTTIYAVTSSSFAAGTVTVDCFIRARRVR
jgi:hypothetical protein